ncbi:MAG TPA: thiolase family protein [Chloroflexota bacterium]|nr:thiolase family protein [Chloroflexota bacterium]
MASVSGRYAIAGIGETQVGRLPERSALSLRLEAAVNAIADAGLSKQAIDGIIAHQPRRDPQPNYAAFLADRLGIQPDYINDISLGGSAAASAVMSAVAAIEAGLCSTVLCVSGESQWSSRGQPSHGRLGTPGASFRMPFGAGGAPIEYGLAAKRHMHEYGTTSQQFGAIAVACRGHACLNPNAQMRTPISIEDHQSSRMIAEPFHLLDCSLVSDGAGALIVTSAERARELRNPPAYVLGMGTACRFGEAAYSPCLTTVAGKEAASRAFAMAGLGPADVDLAELYDCFTYTVLVTLEDYGFCRKGEGGAFVEDGRIELGGQLPVNTHGGLLSQAHVGGMLHITEGVTQIRHQAGERQVQGAQVAAVSGQCGELGIHATLLLGASN